MSPSCTLMSARHSRPGAPSTQALTSARVVNRRQARAVESQPALPAEHRPRAAVQPGGLPVERHQSASAAGAALNASKLGGVCHPASRRAPANIAQTICSRVRVAANRTPAPGLDFGFHRPTKDWLQTPTSPAPENAAVTIGYKFRTNLAES
jgi:hypothetical protein